MINLFLAQNDNFKLVRVTFPNSSKKYTYKSFANIAAGDQVIVDSPRDGLTIVNVVEVIPGIESDLNFNFSLKWIVQKVDMSDYEAAQEVEAKINTQLNKLEASRKQKGLLAEATETLGLEQVQELTKLVRL